MFNTRLIIIRHGETEYNVKGLFQGQLDAELTEKGKKQAACAAERLKDTTFDVLYASPLKRTLDTAQIVKGNRELEINIENSIMEIKCGHWEGMKITDIQANDLEAFLKWENEPHLLDLPGGETFTQVYDRVSQFLAQIIGRHQGETVVIVSHMVAILLMLVYLSGEKIENVWKIGRQPNAAINIIDIDGHGIITFPVIGDNSHIEGENVTLPEWEPQISESPAVNFA